MSRYVEVDELIKPMTQGKYDELIERKDSQKIDNTPLVDANGNVIDVFDLILEGMGK